MARLDFIVPIAMKLVAADLNPGKLFVRNFDAGLVDFGIQLSVNLETCFGSGRRDEVDDCLKTAQRLPTPVLRDVRKQPMFDLVPFAGARREMTHRDAESSFIG